MTYPLGYSPGLDGVRGMMTLAVMGAHTRPALFPGAIVFMDSFFAMSGFLITSLLLNEYRKTSRIDLGKFYLRRFMRLYPALVAMLLTMLTVTALLPDFRWRVLEAVVAFFYLTDYWRAFHLPGPWLTAHTWSLAVEEQFYLAWPIVLIGVLRWTGVSWRSVGIILMGALGFALWRAWLVLDGASIPRLYNPFDTRADSLLIGCALAFVLKLVDLGDRPWLARALACSLLPISAFGLAAALNLNDEMRWHYCVSPLFGAIPAAIFTAGLMQKRRAFIKALYEHPVPVFCGRICYGLYVWHHPVFILMKEAGAVYIVVFLVGWPIVFALAIASYYFIERPFMRARPV